VETSFVDMTNAEEVGGAVHWPEAPEWRCVTCGHEWGEAEVEAWPSVRA
jgi:hypothetical protein